MKFKRKDNKVTAQVVAQYDSNTIYHASWPGGRNQFRITPTAKFEENFNEPA